MADLKKVWVELPPKTKRAIILSSIAAAVLGLSYILTDSAENSKSKHEKATVKSVLTDTDTREVGIESLAAQLKRLEKQQYELSKKTDRLINKQERDAAAIAQATKMASTLEKITSKLDSLEERFAEQEARVEMLKTQIQDLGTAAPGTAEPVPVDTLASEQGRTRGDSNNGQRARSEVSVEDRRPDDYFKIAPLPGEGASAAGSGQAVSPAGARSNGPGSEKIAADTTGKSAHPPSARPSIRVIRPKEDEQTSEVEKGGEVAYLPSGSIITGVLLNGMDAPTGKNARKNPFPSVLRIQKEAILPNYHRSDIRECFAIVSGYGDLSSERAYLRAESISCVRDDGSVLESGLNAYAVGEDGKVGVRGRLVSKQGQLIAKSLMAGFLSGVSQAFNMQPVPSINTNPGDSVSYQSLLTAETLQSGVATGASKALDRIAQYYLDMADNIFPVIEVDAGRKIELIVSKGSKITLRQKGNRSDKKK